MVIIVKDIILSPLATNLQDGDKLFIAITKFSPSDLTISFEGISHISTAFLNQSIGNYVLKNKEIGVPKFIYPSNKSIFASKIDDVIENALMGEDYDALVDNALASL